MSTVVYVTCVLLILFKHLLKQVSQEKAANLDIAIKQINELKSKLEVVGGVSQSITRSLLALLISTYCMPSEDRRNRGNLMR